MANGRKTSGDQSRSTILVPIDDEVGYNVTWKFLTSDPALPKIYKADARKDLRNSGCVIYNEMTSDVRGLDVVLLSLEDDGSGHDSNFDGKFRFSGPFETGQ